MPTNTFTDISTVLNGPIMTVVFIFGIFFNAITIYILSLTRLPYRLDSNIRLYYKPTEPLLHKFMLNEGHGEIWHRHINSIIKRKKKRPRIYIYLLWLTGCDTFLLVCAFMNFSIPAMFDCLSGVYANFIPIWYMLCNTTFVASVWLMLMFVKDRYQALCSRLIKIIPTQHTNHWDVHMKLFTISLVSLLFSIPRLFELRIVRVEPYGDYSIELTTLIESPFYMIGYRIFGSLIFYSAIPYVFVFIMSSKIYWYLRSATKIRAKMNVTSKTSTITSDSDLLIIALAIRFLVSRLPTTFLDVVESFIGSTDFLDSPFTLVAVSISNLFVACSSATTFFILFAVSSKFRGSVMVICCGSRLR